MIKLDKKCKRIRESVLEMASIVSTMYHLSLEAMETKDIELAIQVVNMDEEVNNKEKEINELAMESLALLSPVASDLRKVIAGIKIASDLERIGDYAKSIGMFTVRDRSLDNEVSIKVKQLGDIFLAMLDHAIDSYNQSDVRWAMTIPEEDQVIDRLFEEIVVMIENRGNLQKNAEELISTVNMLRNLKRAGDHTKNICEHTIFEVKGQYVEFN